MLILLAGIFGASSASAALKVADLKDRAAVIEYASQTGDWTYLTRLSMLLADEKARGDAAPLPHYYAALAAYRAAEIDEDVELRVGVLLDRCIDQTKAALKIRPDWSEALALAGACHGLAARRQPLSALIAGNFAARELKQALVINPENPRAMLLQAVTLLRRFEDPDRVALARQLLVDAIARFEQFPSPTMDGGPTWGEEHAHFWLAHVASLNRDTSAARDHLEQALLIAPDLKIAQVSLARIGR
ncbi:MAG: hypothetical protein AAGL69_08400 [Pseudomonadota bacterium]